MRTFHPHCVIDDLTVIVTQSVSRKRIAGSYIPPTEAEDAERISDIDAILGKGVPVVCERRQDVDPMLLCKSYNGVEFLESVCSRVDSSRPVLDRLEPSPVLRNCVNICDDLVSTLVRYGNTYH
jgi:hypothetical protein